MEWRRLATCATRRVTRAWEVQLLDDDDAGDGEKLVHLIVCMCALIRQSRQPSARGGVPVPLCQTCVSTGSQPLHDWGEPARSAIHPPLWRGLAAESTPLKARPTIRKVIAPSAPALFYNAVVNAIVSGFPITRRHLASLSCIGILRPWFPLDRGDSFQAEALPCLPTAWRAPQVLEQMGQSNWRTLPLPWLKR
jgi:hypothetical protein